MFDYLVSIRIEACLLASFGVTKNVIVSFKIMLKIISKILCQIFHINPYSKSISSLSKLGLEVNSRGAGATGTAWAAPPPRPLLMGAAGVALPFSHSD